MFYTSLVYSLDTGLCDTLYIATVWLARHRCHKNFCSDIPVTHNKVPATSTQTYIPHTHTHTWHAHTVTHAIPSWSATVLPPQSGSQTTQWTQGSPHWSAHTHIHTKHAHTHTHIHTHTCTHTRTYTQHTHTQSNNMTDIVTQMLLVMKWWQTAFNGCLRVCSNGANSSTVIQQFNDQFNNG